MILDKKSLKNMNMNIKNLNLQILKAFLTLRNDFFYLHFFKA